MKRVPSKRSKCLIQNVESNRQMNSKQDIRPSVEVIREPVSEPQLYESEPDLQLVASRLSQHTKFSKPEVNSTLRYAKAIMEIEKLDVGKVRSIDDLNPLERKLVKAKISESVNTPSQIEVFKNLIPLEVNDDDIEKAIAARPIKRSTKYMKKDIEPKLVNFYVPKKRGEYKAIPDTPSVTNTSVRSYNGMSLYQKMSCWRTELEPLF